LDNREIFDLKVLFLPWH